VHDLYFQVMKEQFERKSLETYPNSTWSRFGGKSAAHWRKLHSLAARGKDPAASLVIAERQRGHLAKAGCAFTRQVQETLDQLKLRYRLAVVSDAQTPTRFRNSEPWDLGEYFRPGHHSPATMDTAKPDPRLSRRPWTDWSFSRQPFLSAMIAYRDIFGAKQLGMKTVLFVTTRGWGGLKAPSRINHHQFSELARAIEFLSGT